MQDLVNSTLETIRELLDEQIDFEYSVSEWNGLKTVKDSVGSGWMSKDAFVFSGLCSVIHEGTIYTYDSCKRKVEPVGKGYRFRLRDALPHGIVQAILEADPSNVTLRSGTLIIPGEPQVNVTVKNGFIETISVYTTSTICLGPGCYDDVPFATTYEFSKIAPGSRSLSSYQINAFRDRGVPI